MSEDQPTEIAVGLVADPGLPLTLAKALRESLEGMLPRQLDPKVNWSLETEKFSMPLTSTGSVDLNVNSQHFKQAGRWDYVVYLTDLPKYENSEPLISSVDASSGTAVVVLPALGLVRQKRLLRAVLQVLAALHGVGDPYLRGEGKVPRRVDPLLIERRFEAETEGGGAFETAKGLRGRILLLLGMVRSNRPWRLVSKLSTAMAAAVATGAFGVFYTSIWSMADHLPPQRLVIISLLAIMIMGLWLVLHNQLWEAPTGDHYKEKRVIYNLATILTIFLAVLLMYVVLFLVILAGSLIIIDVSYLAVQLRHDVGINEYVNLSWLATSLGIMAGAVGSSMDDEESVRKATFSRREYERRQITLKRNSESEE